MLIKATLCNLESMAALYVGLCVVKQPEVSGGGLVEPAGFLA